MITQERLKFLFSYDEETGVFTRIRSARGNAYKGRQVTSCDNLGRVMIGADKKCYFAHRLAWVYVYGFPPINCIDHIDGNPSNNAISNLRDVNHAVNMQNQRRASKNNSTGIIGVSQGKGRRTYRAQITINGRSKPLGRFKSAEDAKMAYLSYKREHHPGCTI